MSKGKQVKIVPGDDGSLEGFYSHPADSSSRKVLDRLVHENPDDESAWLALGSLTPEPAEKRRCFRNVLRINPHNHWAIVRLRELDAYLSTEITEQPIPRPRIQTNQASDAQQGRHVPRWLGQWLFIAAAVLLLGGFLAQTRMARQSALPTATAIRAKNTPTTPPTPEPTNTPTLSERILAHIAALEMAWRDREWQTADALLAEIQLLDPAYPGLEAARCDTYLHWAGDLTTAAQVEEAYAVYRKAFGSCSERPTANAQRSLTLQYLTGQWRYEHGLWRQAAIILQAVYDNDPHYADTAALLHDAYLAWARAAWAGRDYRSVQTASRAALKLRPDDQEMTELLDQASKELEPTPTATPRAPEKRIEVNITEQRMYVWEDDRLVYKWLCSTGEPGRNTAAGHYQILDKIPEAWASTWSLRMPYWMGIYYAGSLENGIHALPILPNGQILWDGYLGTPVSYGCVILSTENARTLFNWAQVGTPVWIHY